VDRRAGRAFDLDGNRRSLRSGRNYLRAANQAATDVPMIRKDLTKEFRMASRQMKMPEKIESEPEEPSSQRKRPELGRYLLQVDRQTKGSYQTVETAQAAAHAIKKEYPILHVTIYDNVECTSTALATPAS